MGFVRYSTSGDAAVAPSGSVTTTRGVHSPIWKESAHHPDLVLPLIHLREAMKRTYKEVLYRRRKLQDQHDDDAVTMLDEKALQELNKELQAADCDSLSEESTRCGDTASECPSTPSLPGTVELDDDLSYSSKALCEESTRCSDDLSECSSTLSPPGVVDDSDTDSDNDVPLTMPKVSTKVEFQRIAWVIGRKVGFKHCSLHRALIAVDKHKNGWLSDSAMREFFDSIGLPARMATQFFRVMGGDDFGSVSIHDIMQGLAPIVQNRRS